MRYVLAIALLLSACAEEPDQPLIFSAQDECIFECVWTCPPPAHALNELCEESCIEMCRGE